ncbi:Putative Catalytic activity: salicylate NADH O(2) <=_ catechol NAD() H(2)O CO(2) [Aspergillus calidoustus]|uniref:Putative Catalytic activity: salicylate NADH O(2) <=> catechol NAD( ) H(2)O CO(2) n=1 Tax=Aspergillus calidoustus TaxID=454130 RepID=A0A0U5G6R4_ASPCI|nr:Putative Catalytic activity: salicylate NADH O(2) <=> catechol NAD() H(2)O CO(2) [Aspergillus calidoustus]
MDITQAKTPLDVVIVGVGIGGIAAALTLGLRGHRITILESAPKLMEVGAGIQVSPNMLRLFDRWGVSPLIHAKDVALERIHVRRWQDGSLLGTMPVNKTFGQQVVIHRADLHNALVEKALELENVELRVNSHVTNVDFDSTTVTLANGTAVGADIVIAADGIKSALRDHLLGEDASKPMATGDAAYRIMLTRSVMESDPELKKLIEVPEATRWLGPERHLIAYPVRNHELYNIVLLHPDRHGIEESWTTKGSKQRMVDDYEGWDPIVTKLIGLVPDDEVLEWKLCLHPPLKTWIKGSVALIGDACHPMLPYVAQGAAQAVEDAAALGIVLSKIVSKQEIPLALKAYEKSRQERANTVQQSGSLNRITLHLPDGPEQLARDEQFRASLAGGENPDKWSDRKTQEFLWGWDAEKAAVQTWEELQASTYSDFYHQHHL